MNRLFVVADDASVEHATRFAQRCPSTIYSRSTPCTALYHNSADCGRSC